MLYLRWGIFNIGLLIFICIKGSKYFSQKFGRIIGLLFVFGLLAFVGSSDYAKDNTERGTNKVKTWEFATPDSSSDRSTEFIQTALEQTSFSNFELFIVYTKDAKQNNIPVSANTWKTGFESGTSWKPVSIIVHRADDNNFEYEVHGRVRWSLLGITLYSQVKHWEGEININRSLNER